MISKTQIKLINSLSQKKYRQKHGLFIAEGIKVIKEILASSYEVTDIFSKTDVFSLLKPTNLHLVAEKELKKISKLTTPQTALALVKIPPVKKVNLSGVVVALDGVRDPGNLGTIIRLCDWFGVEHLLCSPDTVDCYNPKVVQASMGSLTRVNIHYRNLPEVIEQTALPVFGTFMEGENVYQQSLPSEGILIMGNEANGIRDDVARMVTHRLSIPQFGANGATESLNVATATAILLSEFKRA